MRRVKAHFTTKHTWLAEGSEVALGTGKLGAYETSEACGDAVGDACKIEEHIMGTSVYRLHSA